MKIGLRSSDKKKEEHLVKNLIENAIKYNKENASCSVMLEDDNLDKKIDRTYLDEVFDELYAAFDKMKAKFPDFIKSVTDCSNYLSNTVAPAYEKVEATASSKIG